MENERPTLSPDQIEDLCRRYREAERSRQVHFERVDVRFSPCINAEPLRSATSKD